jgi:hypothetical protein
MSGSFLTCHTTTENIMFSFVLELASLEDEDVVGGVAFLLGLGFDDLKDVEDPRLWGKIELLIEANIFEEVEDTWEDQGWPGFAEITSIQAKIKGELVEFPDVLDLDGIAEHVFEQSKEVWHCEEPNNDW